MYPSLPKYRSGPTTREEWAHQSLLYFSLQLPVVFSFLSSSNEGGPKVSVSLSLSVTVVDTKIAAFSRHEVRNIFSIGDFMVKILEL